MSSKHNIALLYFGVPRGASKNRAHHVDNIIHPLAGRFDITERYHFFRPDFIQNPRSGESGQIPFEDYDIYSDCDGVISTQSTDLLSADLELLTKFPDPYSDNYRSIQNLLFQLRSLATVYSLCENDDFKAFIFLRPDLIYLDPLPVDAIERCIQNPSLYYVPEWQWWDGINDRFAICGKEAAIHYARRGCNVASFLEATGAPLKSEALLAWTMKFNAMKLKTIRTRAARTRLGGIVKPEEFSAWKTTSSRKIQLKNLAQRIKDFID